MGEVYGLTNRSNYCNSLPIYARILRSNLNCSNTKNILISISFSFDNRFIGLNEVPGLREKSSGY